MKAPSITTLAFLSFSSLGIWMGQRCRSWHNEGEYLKSKLLDSDGSATFAPFAKQSWTDLPPIVQEYFLRTFPLHPQDPSTSSSPLVSFTPRIRSLQLHQKGTFCLKDGGDWLTFTAQQTVRALPAHQVGFLWQAEMPLIQGGYPGAIHVRDAWVDGKPVLEARLAGIISVASEPSQPSHQEPLLVGEMMRWLAEAFLIPTSFLPQVGLVEWTTLGDNEQEQKNNYSNKVRLSMKDPHLKAGSIIQMDVTFQLDDDNGIDTIVVECQRPARVDGGTTATKSASSGFENRPWIGVLTRFEPVLLSAATRNSDSSLSSSSSLPVAIRIPMHMKAGWKRSHDQPGVADTADDVFYYFVGDNHDVQMDWYDDDDDMTTRQGLEVNGDDAAQSILYE